jgi:hypothetical protein
LGSILVKKYRIIDPIIINRHPRATSRLCLPKSTPHNFAVITVKTKKEDE